MLKNALRYIPIALFLLSLAAAIWFWGAVSAKFWIFPFPQLNAIYEGTKDYIKPNKFHQAVYERVGARTLQPEAIAPGVTLLTSFFPELDWAPGVRVINTQGETLHEWQINGADIFPNRASVFGANQLLEYVHGSYLFPNGDILINIEYVGIARLDRCGNVIWARPDTYAHHSIAPTHDGNFWITGARFHNADPAGIAYLSKYKILHPPVYEDIFVKISPDGEILQTVSSLEVIFDNGLQHLLPRLVRPSQSPQTGFSGDIFHVNDVEELSPDLADSYPLFEAGDIVVSFRQLHSVFVIDPDTGKVRWRGGDPLILQHDPDFIGDGKIGVYNNNRDLTFRGDFNGGSQIISFEPHTGKTEALYPINNSEHFYSAFAGKWQTLSNGNYLIAEPRAGRAFEATPEGNTVWEWINERFRSNWVPEVLEASRYPYDEADVKAWNCAQ